MRQILTVNKYSGALTPVIIPVLTYLPRGRIDNPIDIDLPERGDEPGNPICVDDFEWSSNWSNLDSDEDYDHRSSDYVERKLISMPCRVLSSRDRSRHLTHPTRRLEASRRRQYAGFSPESLVQASPNAESARKSEVRNNVRSFVGAHRKPRQGENSHSASGISSDRMYESDSQSPSNIHEYRKERMQVFVDIIPLQDFDRSKYHPLVTEDPPTYPFLNDRESPFIIPEGEEDLWCDFIAEDERDSEMVEYYLINDEAHPDNLPVPQPVMGVCGPKASTLPRFTNLPLSRFIGDFTLDKHAEIEPRSVAFRKALIASELKNQDILLRDGAAGAAVMMKKLGIFGPINSRPVYPKQNNRSKRQR